MSYFIGISNGNKIQYNRFNEVHRHAILRPVFNSIIVGFCILFLILSAWNFKNTINPTNTVYIFYLNSTYSPMYIVSNKLLSFGLDTSLLRDMKNFPIDDEKFINLARHLEPAYVRIGGTSSDCLYFNQTTRIISKRIINPVDRQDISNFTITDIDFENLYKFAKKSKLQMIFDLNVLIRNDNNSWNDTNAKNIILFARNKNMKLDWQLGNEPNSFRHVFNRTVTATQLADDYYHLRQLLNAIGYNKSLIVGPEVNHVGDTDHKGEYYTQTFLENDKDSVNFVTWHQYYLNGQEARVTDFINPSTFNYLPIQIKSMKEAITLSGKNISMWLSETSTAYGGGAPELSDKFVAGFLWLDKLGYGASTGINVIIRQSLFGGNYAMIGSDLMPNPDWWVSVVYKQFISNKVLKLTSTKSTDCLRLYAHCTSQKALINRVPAVTVYGVNIDKVPAFITIQGIFPVLHRDVKIFLYLLTSDNLQSRIIKMNGRVLKLQPNGDLPPFWPIILDPLQTINLPAYSMVFIVIHGTDIPACKT